MLAYFGALSNGFVDYDDEGYVTENPHVRAGLTPASVAWAFTTTEGANWHPVTWLSHMADVTLFDLDAGGHHAGSVALHAGNAVLLFLVLVSMTGAGGGARSRPACLRCIPLHVESVAWIAERKDVLSTSFWLLTLAAWLRWVERKTAARYALVVVLYALGLLAKPMLVTLPFTLLLLDVWPLAQAGVLQREGAAVRHVARVLASSRSSPSAAAGPSKGSTSIPMRGSNRELGVVLRRVSREDGVARARSPCSIRIRTSRRSPSLCASPPCSSRGRPRSPGCCETRRPFFSVGWLWYVGTLVPVIGWVQVGAQGSADRYTYVPLIGIFIVIAWSAGELARAHRSLRPVLTAGASPGSSCLPPSRDGRSVTGPTPPVSSTRALAVTDNNWLAHNNLAAALSSQGKQDEAIAQLTGGAVDSARLPGCALQPRSRAGTKREARRGDRRARGGPADRAGLGEDPEQPRRRARGHGPDRPGRGPPSAGAPSRSR